MRQSLQGVAFDFSNDARRQSSQSLWALFLDAIQQNPKMDKLQEVIQKAKEQKADLQLHHKDKLLESYLAQKKLEEERRRANRGHIQKQQARPKQGGHE